MVYGSCAKVEGGVWGCIVVFAAFMIQVLGLGTVQSIGVYNIEFLQHFDTGSAAVSLVGSICLGVFMGAGPLASFLMSKWDHRRVALLGAALTSIGLICTSFAPSIPYMYVFFGVITGLGGCFTYVPSHILSGLYFHKYRSLSTGIATAGSGIGATIFPVIIYELTEIYGWRGSLLIVAGLNLHLLVFAALLRPVPEKLKKSLAEMENMESDKKIVAQKFGEIDNEPTEMLPQDQNKSENKQTLPKVSFENTSIINNDNDLQINIMGEELKEDNTNTSVDDAMTTTPGHSHDIIQRNVGGNQHSTTIEYSNTHKGREERRLSVFQRLKRHFCGILKFDFIMYCMSNIFWNAGGGIIVVFFPEYMLTVGLDKQSVSLAYMFVGVGICIGCIAGGLLGIVKYFDRVVLYILGNIGAGAITLLIPWTVFHTNAGLSVLSFSFGLMFGVILGLLVVVTSDLLGTEKLGDGFGYVMLCNGVGVFAGPPVAGMIIDHLGYMDAAMYCAGGITIAGSLLMCIVPLHRRIIHTPPITSMELIIDPP